MSLRSNLMIAPLLLAQLLVGGSLHAQPRPGIPGGLPVQVGIPANVPRPASFPRHGPPDDVGAPPAASQFGSERAAVAREQAFRMSKPEAQRAAEKAKANPGDYELDKNGALAISGEVLASGLDAAQLARIERAGFTVLRRSDIGALGITIAVISHPGMAARKAAERLRRIEPEGSYDLNHVFSEAGAAPVGTPAVPQERTGEGRPATVGLIDTGVASSVALAPRVSLVKRKFSPGPESVELHGTAVAELLAGRSGRVVIYAADIFGPGPRVGTTEQLLQALGWLAGERVPVINISMVGPPNNLVAEVVAKFVGLGFTIVAPVGNDGAAARPLYPASYPGVIAVSAAGADGQLLPEASRVKRVDFVAPGIASVLDPAGKPTLVRGTSFAAPIVSRELAEAIEAPDVSSSRRALARLKRDARIPESDRQWSGHGLVRAPG